MDFALAPNELATALVVHRPDCADVRRQADAGEPVLTMFGCERPPGPEFERHTCLEEGSS